MITQRHNRSFICTHTLTQTQTYTLFGLPFGSKTFESLIAGTTPQCSLLQLTPWGESNSLIRPKIRPLLQVLALEYTALAYRLGPKSHGEHPWNRGSYLIYIT